MKSSPLEIASHLPKQIGDGVMQLFTGIDHRDESYMFQQVKKLAENIDNKDIESKLWVVFKLAGFTLAAAINPNGVRTYVDAINSIGIDDLTRVSKRGRFISTFNAETQREGNNALMMFDVINFREINNEHGHVVGDKFLIAIANSLKNNFRSTDRDDKDEIGKFSIDDTGNTGRYGGDEFVVMMQGGTGLSSKSLPEITQRKTAEVLLDEEITTLLGKYPDIEEFGLRVGSSMTRGTFDQTALRADPKTETKFEMIVRKEKEGYQVYTVNNPDDSEKLADGFIDDKQRLLIPVYV